MARRRVLMASRWGCALLACVPAWAADLADKAPPAPAGAGTWTGLYLGSFVGAGMADSSWRCAGSPLATAARQQPSLQNSGSGGLIGAQLGYNYQLGALVLGIEADAGSGFQSATVQCLRGWASTCTTDTDVLGTLAARVGYGFDNLLLYGKVGAALTNESYTIAGNTYAGQFTGTQTRTGWTAGGGVEMALTPQFSVKAEYAFLDFGESDATLVKGPDRLDAQTSASAQMVKLGLNYRPFGAPLPGAGPLPASPGRDWSGVYLGAFAGGAWGRNDWADGTGTSSSAAARRSPPPRCRRSRA
ncbi:outer membrane beta-barrel protein [Xanthobacter sp. KR7-225]|uniref:outer membrane protein n=1 Tax=Xanthobacter sp. KR7-225 TaxID=3156613 RepID=UPI0032B3134E